MVRCLSSLAIVAGITGALGGCKERRPESHESSSSAPEAREDGVDVTLSPKALEAARLATEKPRVLPRRASVVAAGTVDFVPSRVARIGPSIAGRVAQIPVVVGQRVAKGAVVVTLESVEAGRARADYLAAKSTLDRASAEVEREQRLVAGGASSERALLLAQTEKASADAQLQATRARLSTLGIAAAAQGGQSIPLVSPVAGSVLEVKARIGQPVGPTDTLVVVGETDQVWLAVEVYERDLGRVRLGDEVHVTSVAFPARIFRGKVDQLGSVVDPERHVLEARIVLPNPDGDLKPGMMATARILGAPAGGAGAGDGGTGNALVVPRQAVQTIDGQPFVFVVRGPGKFELRAVERGGDLEGDVEVLRGLSVDEEVVVDGSFILKSEVLKAQMGAND